MIADSARGLGLIIDDDCDRERATTGVVIQVCWLRIGGGGYRAGCSAKVRCGIERYSSFRIDRSNRLRGRRSGRCQWNGDRRVGCRVLISCSQLDGRSIRDDRVIGLSVDQAADI